ncbi:MAG: hypothetical protein AAF206_00950 [Bacteroidota bacterium]
MNQSEEQYIQDLFGEEELADTGFTKSVITLLPLRQQSHLRRWLSLGVSTVIALLVGLQGEVPVDLYAGVSEVATICMEELAEMGSGVLW